MQLSSLTTTSMCLAISNTNHL
ncbi:unnamed protein product [Ectocarpus sp. CCAP 1310/34]|nr:unnamed protein product [Ectocarpus sp. CCAP 1310/34]